MLKHRRDIDGLRAVAVLPVVLFHARLGVFPGGYVGVDVFFVISGFLITSLLRQELERGDYSIVRFYERRVRRLFPALFAMLAITCAAAWWLLAPNELREFGQSVVATSLFASNLFFWLESGYFARAAENLPLLHTWSLAVEEQYYMVFPPLLWLLWRGGRRVIAVALVALTALSFAAAVWMVRRDVDQAFYLPHLRAWELFIGALLAFDVVPRVGHRVARELIATVGLVAILGAMLLYDSETPFPGLAALAPCLGTAAIIHAGSGGASWVATLLGQRLPVAVGLISYSLYLWHWPIFVLQRHYTVLPPSRVAIIAAIVLAFIAATLSWRYVERPFRGQRLSLSASRLFAAAAAVLVLFIGTGFAAHVSQGFATRYSADVLARGAVTREDPALRERCFQLGAARYRAREFCRLGTPDTAPDFMVWGDSHSLMYVPALERLAGAAGRSGVFFGSTACPPLAGVDPGNRSRAGRDECMAGNAAALAVLADTPSIKTVILVARWSYYVEGTETAVAARSPTLLIDEQVAVGDSARNAEVVERSLSRTLEQMRAEGRRVVTFETVPEVEVSVPDAMAQAAILARRIEFAPPTDAYHLRQARTRALFERLRARHPEFESIALADVLCDAEHCRVEQDGKPLYYDDNHLSPLGVDLLKDKLASALNGRR